MSDFRVPFGPSETEFTEKRSRFIGHLLPVETEEQAREFIAQMKKKYYDALHNCWCYLIGGDTMRYGDDGEPQGTAGQPMLNVFQRENVTNVVCVVTRYFGGVLLGLLTAHVHDRTCKKAHKGILGGVFSGERWSFTCMAALAAVLGFRSSCTSNKIRGKRAAFRPFFFCAKGEALLARHSCLCYNYLEKVFSGAIDYDDP